MTTMELQWLVGTALSAVLVILGIAVTAFRAVSLRIEGAVKEMREAVTGGDKELHDRVSRLRQDVSDNFVRRVDLESHMKRVDDNNREMRDDIKILLSKVAKL